MVSKKHENLANNSISPINLLQLHFWVVFRRTFFNLINLYYVGTLGLVFFLDGFELQNKIVYSVFIFGGILAQFLIEYYKLFRRFDFFQKTINKKYRLLLNRREKDSCVFKQVKACRIKMGDIVILNQDDVSPCNILILSHFSKYFMNNDCFVSSSLITDGFEIIQKRGIDKLKPKNDLHNVSHFKEYLKMLNFSVELMGGDNNEEFKAVFRLYKDPKSEELSIKNVVEKN